MGWKDIESRILFTHACISLLWQSVVHAASLTSTHLHEAHAAHHLDALISDRPRCFLTSKKKKKFLNSSKVEKAELEVSVRIYQNKSIRLSYRGEDLANGCFDLEFFGPTVHVSTDHVGHRLDMEQSRRHQLESSSGASETFSQTFLNQIKNGTPA